MRIVEKEEEMLSVALLALPKIDPEEVKDRSMEVKEARRLREGASVKRSERP